ncbi:MAG: exodeoxyribonuclease VII small subunit [Burkholderiaceae bacterium]|nr:exodeoxyribonuclease VII small subunit [Burkholderiaceae bacterium]
MPKKPVSAEPLSSGAAVDLPSTFEEAMAELQQLVSQMESGELALEASIGAYKRGADLVKYCMAQLDKVDNQVKILEGDMLKPFAAEGSGDEA